MSVAKLNVEIGVRIAELQKGLRNAERELRRSGNNFARIGGDLTTSLSAPLGLLGTAAISAAGDIESLTLALKSQLGSSEAAAKELGLLTEAAKNPGLGVEQAVRGSVRLQGVGLAAEEAREVLVQMGNAIAATGGSAQELDSVTRQFAQMISKGRVLQEDVSILSENMPGLAQMMQKAFGTQSVENIRAMGVSGKEFVMRITEAAKELPRVEGGIKNSIGNAVDALKQSAAKLGFALNEAFDITGTIERVTTAVLGLANWFSSLSDTSQNVVLTFAAILAAAGPLVRIWGNLSQLASLLAGGFNSMVSFLKAVAAGAVNAGRAFMALNTAMKVTVIGALVAAIGLAIAAYDEYAGKLSDTERVQRSLEDIQKTAAANVAGQKQQVENLVAAYKAEGVTLDQKRNILNELKRISPEYFGAIKAGKGDIEAITAATAKYSEELIRVARVTAAKDRLVEIEKELLNLNKTADPTLLQTVGNAIASFGNAGQFAANQAKTLGGNIVEQTKALEAERTALAGVVVQQTIADASTGKLNATTSKFTGSVEKLTGKAKVYADVLADIESDAAKAKLFGEDADVARVDALRKGIEKLVEAGFKPASKEIQNLKREWDALTARPSSVDTTNIASLPIPTNVQSQSASPGLPNAPIPTTERALTSAEEVAAKISELTTGLQDGVLRFGDAFSQISEIVTSQGSVMQNVFLGMGEAISQAAAEGATSFAQLGKAAAGAAAKIIRAYIQQGVAAAVAKALSSVPFPFNLAAGAAAGGIAAALFTNLIGKIGIKAFASGTRDAPGGLSLVGERGPELVNLPKHSQVFSAGQTYSMMKGGSAVEIFGEFRVKGTDLVLVFEREQAKQKRFR